MSQEEQELQQEEAKQSLGNTRNSLGGQPAEQQQAEAIVEAYRPNLYDVINTLQEGKVHPRLRPLLA